MKVILIGIQGSGKSTQGTLLSKKLGVPYLATGDILRNLARKESPSGKYIREMLTGGHLIPDDKTIAILKEYLAKRRYLEGYILDGFPRTLVQAKSFTEPIDRVIYVKVSDEEARHRLRLRIDKEKRADDSEKAIRKRIELFHRMTAPVLDYYRQKGLLLEIDGERSIEDIHKDIAAQLGLVY